MDEMTPQATEEPTAFGFEILSWEIPEYQKHDRNRWWYWLYAVAMLGCIVYALWTSNFLFAIILIIGSLIVILHDARHPQPVPVVITTEGVVVGNSFYDYDDMLHFAIVYKPNQELKRVYFEFKRIGRHRLSIALYDINPLFLRDNLLRYLPEDLERNDEPFSEFLSRLLKL